MLIYSANARRVVAINGNMMAPARATIDHYRVARHRADSRRRAARGGRSRRLRRARDGAARVRHHVAGRRARAGAAAREEGFPMHVGLARRSRMPRRSDGRGGRVAAHQREAVPDQVAVVGARLSARRQSAAARQRHQESRARKFFQARARRRSGGEKSRARGRPATRRASASIAATSRATSSHGRTPTAACSRRPTSRASQRESRRRSAPTIAASPSSNAGRGRRVRYFCSSSKLLEGFDLAAMGHNSTDYIHTVIEAAKLAFADREAYYGDPGIRRRADRRRC